MLKEDVLSFVVYMLMVAVAAIVGFAVISPVFRNISTINGWNVTVYLLVALIIAAILEIILFELAHIIGAKIGGYEILSINFIGFCFYKAYNESKKKYTWKFKFPKGFNGLTGETIITPKSEKSNPTYFVLSPLVMYAIEVALLIFAYTFITKPSSGQNPLDFIKYFQLLVVTIGGMLFLYNYFPAKLDCLTDGYRLVLLNKKVNIEAYNVLLKIEGDEFLGKTENEYKTFKEITDFTAQVNLQSVRNYIKNDKYENAQKLIEGIIVPESKITFETKVISKVYQLNIALMNGTDDDAKKVYDEMDDKEKDYLKSEFTMLTIRTAILYYGIIEKSESECENQLHNVKKALNKELELNRKSEEVLLRKSIDILNKRNSDMKVTY